MKQDTSRLVRLEVVLRDELVGILKDDVHDPRVREVRIVALTLSVDYRHARVHFTLKGDDPKEVQAALARATPFVRSLLFQGTPLKRTPELRFLFAGHRSEEEPCSE
jgi:ribosome-binding factor A